MSVPSSRAKGNLQYGSSRNSEYEGKLNMSGKQQSNRQIAVGVCEFFPGLQSYQAI